MAKGKTKYVLLGLLAGASLSGYEMRKRIKQSISHFWSESNGQLYPTLNKLMHDNLIKLEEEIVPGKKVRYRYSITPDGLQELTRWLDEIGERKSTHRDEDLLRLFFGSSGSIKACVKRLTLRQQRAQFRLNEYRVIQQELEQQEEEPRRLYWLLTVKNGIEHVEAECRWCQEAIAMLKNKEVSCTS